jgi:hypothetical protein
MGREWSRSVPYVTHTVDITITITKWLKSVIFNWDQDSVDCGLWTGCETVRLQSKYRDCTSPHS